MNGAHDLGGMHGLGAINPEPDEPVFHEEWERRCFALTLACGYARERMHPATYLQTSYYEHWLFGLQTLLVEKGLITEEEIATRMGEIGSVETD
jgi:hypothetical protein